MYQLAMLPYSFQDLEPFIDTHTMGLHYHKHEMSYLNNLNNLLRKYNYNYIYNLSDLVYHINEFNNEDKANILFNLGGVLNHELYWKSMNKRSNLPKGKLKNKIDSQYGDFSNFWNEFKRMALSLKGSGYTFLVLRKDGNLEIINFHNQDIPSLYGYTPLFNIDLWEHAYYLNYENDRSKYIDNFREIVDFTNAGFLYDSMT